VLDHWLHTAFGHYSIADVGNDEHVRRVLACRELIWGVAEELLRRDVDVILDDGFFLREHRMQYAAMARDVDADAMIHFVNPSRDVIEARLEKRNRALPPDNFKIDASMLERFCRVFETPSADEGLQVVEIGGDADVHRAR